MKPWIEAVLSLQSLDMKIRGIETKLATMPVERARLDAELKAAESSVTMAREHLRGVEKEVKALETRMGSVEEAIRKLLIQSAMVKKNNEYQTMMADIESKKKEISDIETAEIDLLDKVEEEKKIVSAAERECAVNTKAVRQEAAELDDFEKDLKQQLKETISLRNAHETKVETKVLDAYKRLLASKKGEPMSRILEGSICSNCRLKITPQTINEAKRGDVTYCDNCSHLIYFSTIG